MSSHPDSAPFQPVAAWMQWALEQQQGGKTLLLGSVDGTPKVAWGAGLRGPDDYPNFTVFARFALQKLYACDGYWLLLPHEQGDNLGYRAEIRSESLHLGALLWLNGGIDVLPSTERAVLDNLLQPGGSLPGLMRRELTALSDQLRLALPSQA